MQIMFLPSKRVIPMKACVVHTLRIVMYEDIARGAMMQFITLPVIDIGAQQNKLCKEIFSLILHDNLYLILTVFTCNKTQIIIRLI